MTAPVESWDDKLKSNHGGFATIVWLIVGAYLFYSEPEARLLSWQALVYFIVGMFVAAAVFGILSYLIMHGVSRALTATGVITRPTPRVVAGLYVIGCVLAAANVVLIYIAARWTIRAMF